MAEKKKILYIITKSNWGGAQRYVYDLATNINRNEFEPVVAFGGEGKLKTFLEEKNIRTISIPHMDRDMDIIKEIKVFFYILRIIKKERPDILHLNSPKAGGISAVAGRITGVKKIIYTAHGWTFREERPLWQKLLIRFFSWLTVVLNHQIIVVSNCDLTEAPVLFVKNKIIMIHNGVQNIPVSNTSSARKKLLKMSGLSSNPKRIYLGTVAELHKNKGLIYAVESLHNLAKGSPNLVFFIVGEGEERQKLENKISELGLKENVILVGYADNAREILSAFDIFILPSVKEGLPYTILEAGQAGLPVIATSVGGISEIIEDMKSGILVIPKRPDELARAVTFILQNKGKALGFGQRLSEKVVQEFSLDKMIEKTSALYRN